MVDDYWTNQIGNLKDLPKSELLRRIENLEQHKEFLDYSSWNNYYEHLKKEYAERIGRDK